MQELLKSVTEAEAKAAAVKTEAQEEAARILNAAHTQAGEILKNAEQSLKLYRESTVHEAEASALEAKSKQLSQKKEEAKKASDALLVDTKSTVSAIVRRVVDGNSRHA